MSLIFPLLLTGVYVLGLLKQVIPFRWIAIIDHSLGTKKALVVLELQWMPYQICDPAERLRMHWPENF